MKREEFPLFCFLFKKYKQGYRVLFPFAYLCHFFKFFECPLHSNSNRNKNWVEMKAPKKQEKNRIVKKSEKNCESQK